jgi:hypothetical protein
MRIGPLAFIAAQTKRMRLGSGVMQLAAPCTGGASGKDSLSLPNMGAVRLNWCSQSKGGGGPDRGGSRSRPTLRVLKAISTLTLKTKVPIELGGF